MNPDTVSTLPALVPGDDTEHVFFTLLDLVALNGWSFILVGLPKVAHVRGDDDWIDQQTDKEKI